VNNAATPTYSGTLTLLENSTLMMVNKSFAASANAVEGASSITMHAGSKIQVNMTHDFTFPAITLAGDASFESLFGASDWQKDYYNGEISGPGSLTLSGFNGHEYHFSVANSFTGGFIANAIDRYKIFAEAAGSLGAGDVTINPRSDGRSASLNIDADDPMADTATLYLNGAEGQGGFSGNGSDYLIMNADDTSLGSGSTGRRCRTETMTVRKTGSRASGS